MYVYAFSQAAFTKFQHLFRVNLLKVSKTKFSFGYRSIFQMFKMASVLCTVSPNKRPTLSFSIYLPNINQFIFTGAFCKQLAIT